jgi:hypothetical protein
VILIVGGFTFLRWSRRRPVATTANAAMLSTIDSEESDRYRSQLERDLDRS